MVCHMVGDGSMISFDNTKTIALGAGVLVLAYVGFKAYQKAASVGGTVVDAIAATPGAVVDAAVGGIEGIGSVVGIPQTNMTQCQKDLAAGKTWDASFSCPAGTWLGSLFGSKPTNTDTGNGYDSSGQRAGIRYDSAGNVIGVY